ncbi:hypothetical protein BDP55DRAFT_637935 [Colletotrichum godetiae]|uniref:Uncharacterized protein n=1 Tax=Colletotrichum godetiae TaxID=1209918 RepID=A0AAJ0EM54_9PEZI|nr:uncharacterized protein BDP55DRAFT_637935 [Colletotrichum godetiae]KAK1658305.1 hypothetical protein BDP55DRAFT_637935 [Colletotrichum godetiae]
MDSQGVRRQDSGQIADSDASTVSVNWTSVPQTRSQSQTTQFSQMEIDRLPRNDDTASLIGARNQREGPCHEAATQASQPAIHVTKSSKPRVFYVHLAVLVVSWIFFILGCCVINPETNWPWSLGFENQLIIVGLLLALMKTCLDEIAGSTLITWQTRHATSKPRYDAVLSRSPFRPKDSGWYYIPLIFLRGLPLGLGVAYKSSIGGEASHSIDLDINMTQTSGRQYGLAPLTKDSLFVSAGNAPCLLSNATFDFFTVSARDNTFNNIGGFPRPFGHRILLLGNSSAATLDLPTYPYISAIQKKLKDKDTIIISATVQGFVTQLNKTIKRLRKDNAF